MPFLWRGPDRPGVPCGGGGWKAHLHTGYGASGPDGAGGRYPPGAAAPLGHQVRFPGADRRHGGQTPGGRQRGVEQPVQSHWRAGDSAAHYPAVPAGGGSHAGTQGDMAGSPHRGYPHGGSPGLAAVGLPQHERLHGSAPGLHRQTVGGGGGALYP